MTAISIVMPLYNKAAFVRESVTALAAQLGPHDEIVVVDDVSTDNGPALLQSLDLANVRLHRMPVNRGPASARNAGAAQAHGTHLLFFDADDLPSPHLLDELRHAIESVPADGVWTFDLAYQAKGEDVDSTVHASFAPTVVLERDAFVASVLVGKPLCTASSTCVRADVFAAAGGFLEGLRYCEDPELWSRLSRQHRIVEIKRTLAIYRDVPSSLSYGLRAQPGSVDPYVRTLLSLSRVRDDAYRRLAASMITRNAVFSVALGGSRRALQDYLTRVDDLLPPARSRLLRATALAPRWLVRAPLALRSALARRRARGRLAASPSQAA